MLESKARFGFGPFVLDTVEHSLRRENELVPLPPKALDLLFVLVSRQGRIVEKEDLLKTVWPDTFVEENNLSVNISTLRKVLGTGGESFIETVPRRGYRFVAPVVDCSVQPIPEAAPKIGGPAANRWTGKLRLLLGFAAVLLVAAAMFWPSSRIQTVAVLPFKGATAGDELGFGLADATIARLGRLPGIHVSPTQAVRRFDAPGQDPVQAGRQLGVAAVLDGTLQQSGNRIRLTVQLIQVANGKHLWAQVFDHAAGDLFALEDALAGALSDTLGPQLTGARRTTVRGTNDAEAHRLYLAARYHFLRGFRGRDAMRKAIEYAGQAIARDSRYPEPYLIQSGAWAQLASSGAMPPREAMLNAKDAALRGVQLGPELAEAHASLAFVHLYYDYDLPASERSWRRALELDPNNELALIAKSDYCLVVGRIGESLEGRKRVQELVPLEPLWVADVAHPLMDAGRYQEALVWTRRALDMDPKFPLANNDLITILRAMGKYEESVAAALKRSAENGTDARIVEELRAAFDQGGIRGYDQKQLENALEQSRRGVHVAPLNVALLYTGLGDKEQAIDWLEKAFEERVPQLIYIKRPPRWKPLYGHPRFENLRAKLGLQ